MPKKNWAEALVDFVDDGDTNRGFKQRLGASLFGSALLHLSILIVFSAVESPPSNEFIIVYFVFAGTVSSIFSLIISTGKKGGLIRRFWYGVTLPIICYLVATAFISSALEIQSIIRSNDQTNWQQRYLAVIRELSFCARKEHRILKEEGHNLQNCIDEILRYRDFIK